jgi:hypothetical protein
MKYYPLVVLGTFGFIAGCGSSPAAPAAVLAVSQGSVALSRTSTVQITATSSQAATTADVTSAATWRTSNPQVATVSAGLITAVGPGTAVITAEHAGQSRAVSVVVRRRVFVRGEVTVTNLAGQPSVDGITVTLDGQQIGGLGASGLIASRTARFGMTTLGRRPAEPGTRDLAIVFGVWASSQHAITFVGGGATVVDLDTDEEIVVLPLEPRQGAFGRPWTEVWKLEIGTFTS